MSITPYNSKKSYLPKRKDLYKFQRRIIHVPFLKKRIHSAISPSNNLHKEILKTSPQFLI